MATCAGTYLHVWSINGDEIASINTATVRNQQILCVCMSQVQCAFSGSKLFLCVCLSEDSNIVEMKEFQLCNKISEYH